MRTPQASSSPPSAPTRRGLVQGLSAVVLTLGAGQGSAQPAAGVPATLPSPTPNPDLLLRAAPFEGRLLRPGGASNRLLAYNERLPGPVLRLKRGAPALLRLANDLPSPTSLHLYGVRGASAQDGVAGLTQAALAPGATQDIAVTPPDSGTFWYHPMVAGETVRAVDRGLAGLLIVEDSTPPLADHDLAVVLDDWRLREDGALDEGTPLPDAARAGRLGNRLTTNGADAPETVRIRPGARLRLRLLNVANARVMPMRFPNGARVIALDGQSVGEPFDPLRRQIILAPGSRTDVMVDAPAKAGEEALVLVALGQGLPILRILAEGDPLEARPPIATLPPNDLPPEIRLQTAQRAEFAISGGQERAREGASAPDLAELTRRFPDPRRIFLINQGFSSGFSSRLIMSVKRGAPVVIAINNRTAWQQSIHVHGHAFRLLHPFDDGWEPYFMDTILVPEGQIARIAFNADNPGRWAIRSSILDHFDAGVAGWFEVT